jgi:hypothetical protein
MRRADSCKRIRFRRMARPRCRDQGGGAQGGIATSVTPAARWGKPHDLSPRRVHVSQAFRQSLPSGCRRTRIEADLLLGDSQGLSFDCCWYRRGYSAGFANNFALGPPR